MSLRIASEREDLSFLVTQLRSRIQQGVIMCMDALKSNPMDGPELSGAAPSLKVPPCLGALRPEQLARPLTRAIAGLIDMLFVLPFAWMIGGWVTMHPLSWMGNPQLDKSVVFAWFVLSAAYMATTSLLIGRTPAQKLLGLRVVTNQGVPPGKAKALARAIASAICVFSCPVLLLIAAIYEFITNRFVTLLQDGLSGTWVLKPDADGTG